MIDLVVQVVDPHEEAPDWNDHAETTNVRALQEQRPSQGVLPRPIQDAGPQGRGFVLGPGGKAGKYELRDKLGQGTFGYVFTARDTELDRDVAFKVLNPSHQTNGDIVARFLQEARASARIRHPGIVTVLDCGRIPTTVGETAFIAMELLEGESLTNRLARAGRLAPESAMEVCRQIASALDAAHRADVLHRDLKPDNIFLVPDPAVPAGERVKVLDFGLAKLGRGGHTQMNTVFGTPRYMSPEQCRSATQIDQRSDVYSLGCILFELITGRTPFDGDLRQLIERHQRATPPRAKSFAIDISQALDDLIDAMLAKDPNARPQTMGAVQAALLSLGHPGMHNLAATMPPRVPQAARDSGVMVVPPTPGQGLPVIAGPVELAPRKLPSAPRKKRRAPFAAAAIAAFVAAAALTAVAARGRTKSAQAAPVPAQTSSSSASGAP
ncbi:MAG: serine/threonine protein kinase [Deltaproteobacteria bacterium]|nr:serine/threonine protein kinase [Deltaproteobacteria bacterium]